MIRVVVLSAVGCLLLACSGAPRGNDGPDFEVLDVPSAKDPRASKTEGDHVAPDTTPSSRDEAPASSVGDTDGGTDSGLDAAPNVGADTPPDSGAGECTGSPECNDGNRCTSDRCVAGKCVHTQQCVSGCPC